MNTDHVDTFSVYRLEGKQWRKLVERDWGERYGHSCELLGDNKLAVLGGNHYAIYFDVLDLKNLFWSEVTDFLYKIAQYH